MVMITVDLGCGLSDDLLEIEPTDFSDFVEFLKLCAAEAFSNWFLLPRGIALFRTLEGQY